MTNDAHAGALTLLVVIAFAALVTVHVAVVSGVAARSGPARAAAALVVPPFAPYAAYRAGQPLRAIAWLCAAVCYGAALILAW